MERLVAAFVFLCRGHVLSWVLRVRLWSGYCCACSFAGCVATMNDMYVDA